MGPMAPYAEQPRETHLGNVSGLVNYARGKEKQDNVSDSLRIRDGGPLSKGPLAFYIREDMWANFRRSCFVSGVVKNDPLAYQK